MTTALPYALAALAAFGLARLALCENALNRRLGASCVAIGVAGIVALQAVDVARAAVSAASDIRVNATVGMGSGGRR